MTSRLSMSFFILFISLNISISAQGVSVNTNGAAADTSAVLDVSSTTKGMLVPRMTQTQRTNIPLPATGLIVYQTDGTAGFYFNAGTPASPNWTLMQGSSDQLRISANGVGISSPVSPTAPLEVYDGSFNRALVVNGNGITTGDVDGNVFTNKFVIDFRHNGYFQFLNGNVAIGQSIATERLDVNGNIQLPAVNDYKYKTAKTKKYMVGVAEMITANPTTYAGRIDDGFNSSTINGLNSLWATGGTQGTVAYFIAPVHLPDGAIITNLTAHLIKNGGSLQSIVELYRTDGTGYLVNSTNLIATATTTGSSGHVTTVSASSVNSSFNVIDNFDYIYFVRWSGEQATQNVRFLSATITYTVTKVD